MVKTKKRKRRQTGLTLIEVMIALLISTVGLMGALAMLGSLLGGTSFARSATDAMTMAQSRIEAVQSRVVTLSNPPNGPESPAELLDGLGMPSATGVYTRTTTWGLSTDGLRRTVAVTVQWTDSANRPHLVTASAERIP